ncbi:phage tail sheath family protein [Sorangium sp. So ce385]|uniref:phage tail sheath family protein n=1 Tax=Sorangium sp. So ce385 TaxID=3133308 RepID=UPI003F5B7870
MATYRTPDVYVEEISTLPSSVAEVGTAIPAFVGYTERATKIAADDLRLKPTKIFSLREFERFYGFPKAEEIAVTVTADANGNLAAAVTEPAVSYLLYYAVKMFFDNGGAQCYITSVGPYGTSAPFVDRAALASGLDKVGLEDEPTLLVIPEAVKLSYADYGSLTQAMLLQCKRLGDRFAVIDVWSGDKREDDDVTTVPAAGGTAATVKKVVAANRDAWAGELKYGAAYYPFLKTTMNHFVKADESNVAVTDSTGTTPAEEAGLGSFKDTSTSIYNFVKAALRDYYVTMPPSGAVVGVYAATDAARGVWKAPANVSLAGVLEPLVRIDNLRQENLNVDPTAGKSINALRAFAGKGTMVWGARTLAGNDNEWRYVSVRRFFNTVEESIKKSTSWAVFESNDANTWVKVRGMIENYLTDKWREGALAGATPRDAFFVKCGLGTTMNAQDILEGRMNVEVGMAVVRPAEFIVLKFSHKLQTS